MKIVTTYPDRIATGLPEMEFATVAGFNGGDIGVFWTEAGGPSPWEMHPDCDELLQIIEGEVTVEILPADNGRPIHQKVSSGGFIIIPKGCWHRQTMLVRTTEIYITPGETLHSNAEDPRLD